MEPMQSLGDNIKETITKLKQYAKGGLDAYKECILNETNRREHTKWKEPAEELEEVLANSLEPAATATAKKNLSGDWLCCNRKDVKVSQLVCPSHPPLAVLVNLRAVKQTLAPLQEQDHRHGQRNTGQHGLLLGIFSLAFLKTLL